MIQTKIIDNDNKENEIQFLHLILYGNSEIFVLRKKRT